MESTKTKGNINSKEMSNGSSETTSTQSLQAECGIGDCRCGHRLATIQTFVALMCILACINGAIAASYLPAVLTTIEQRFELGSATSGLVVASYEIGATLTVIFVSYLGHHRHIPVWLGVGNILIGIGSVVFSLPHFIAPKYSETLSLLGTIKDSTNGSCVELQLHCTDLRSNDSKQSMSLYIGIFIVAQTLIGIGSTPILTLGLSYVDKHVSRRTSAIYLGEFDFLSFNPGLG